MEITIDNKAGYCFGVEYAIQMAEQEMEDNGQLYCLGDIVHNSMEVERLNKKGLQIIDRDELKQLRNCKVLIRAHGEPPETYKLAIENNIELVDASCPVVLKLQNRVKHAFDRISDIEGQIVIYGKKGHAEVIGLNGQTNNSAIVISSKEDLDQLDYTKPITLFSQTTKSTKGFYEIKAEIEKRQQEAINGKDNTAEFVANDSICRQVSNREPQMDKFSQENDVIVFVSGKKSSNGKSLFNVCLRNNSRSYFIENESEVNPSWFNPNDKIGISGATSTPMWLMQNVADYIRDLSCEPVK
ncbi:4-hydroxy-3-methylbut-2-enyl diphosphate reductase [Chondrinema litorale]|uniref:4-hydroxy-3-methylbut-2-enyl diphosphate reductase n=1 Tax=Chondrinema litorale TaxID=2994555 RepID=UPI002544C4EB|nr:4-hydroxy-3-methylbut-2-enyl diphosphate reductase [Chondrinema litorale]UZR93993.1 4-hydroxy-3-methylbut-2-enyl diphosphate reductase [Chondrinema litorale]